MTREKSCFIIQRKKERERPSNTKEKNKEQKERHTNIAERQQEMWEREKIMRESPGLVTECADSDSTLLNSSKRDKKEFFLFTEPGNQRCSNFFLGSWTLFQFSCSSSKAARFLLTWFLAKIICTYSNFKVSSNGAQSVVAGITCFRW